MSFTPAWIDGEFATAQACTVPQWARGIAELDELNVFTQDWTQNRSDKTATALGTAHPVETTAYLVEESPEQDLGGDVVKWTRSYAKIPSTHTFPGGTISFSFPGFYGFVYTLGSSVTTIDGRERFTKTVKVRINREYFLCITGQTYTTPGAIPIIDAQGFFYGDPDDHITVDYLADSPPLVTASTPSRTDYLAVVAGGSGLGTGADAGEIVAEVSRIYQYHGPIWCRETPYIKAL